MTSIAQFSVGWKSLLNGGSVLVLAVGVAKSFEWFDGMISDKARIALWMFLADIPNPDRIQSWGSVFPHLIDLIFGSRALSLKFFFRSCVASLLALLIVTPLYYLVVGPKIAGGTLPTVLTLVLVLSPITNLVPDYLSVLVTRTIVRLLAKRPTMTRGLILFVVDVIVTAIVAELSVYALIILFVATMGLIFNHAIAIRDFFTLSGVINIMGIMLRGGYYKCLFCVFTISAFFTSIWLWIYLLSIGLIRVIQRIRTIWMWILPFLDIEKKPMIAIGRVAGVLAGAMLAIILAISWIVQRWH